MPLMPFNTLEPDILFAVCAYAIGGKPFVPILMPFSRNAGMSGFKVIETLQYFFATAIWTAIAVVSVSNCSLLAMPEAASPPCLIM